LEETLKTAIGLDSFTVQEMMSKASIIVVLDSVLDHNRKKDIDG
jgi:hypothetical protein